MGFYTRSVWGFEAIARVLLDVWLGFQLLIQKELKPKMVHVGNRRFLPIF